MFLKCRCCAEKDKHIEFLEKQNKDLHDRLMAFNKDAFCYYKAETKQGEPLYPVGMALDGKIFSYKDVDMKKAADDTFRAMGEEPITVDGV